MIFVSIDMTVNGAIFDPLCPKEFSSQDRHDLFIRQIILAVMRHIYS